jgi:hypothetical protein
MAEEQAVKDGGRHIDITSCNWKLRSLVGLKDGSEYLAVLETGSKLDHAVDDDISEPANFEGESLRDVEGLKKVIDLHEHEHRPLKVESDSLQSLVPIYAGIVDE